MNHETPLHPDLSRWAGLLDIAYRGGNEWSSACPQCGGGRGGRDLSDRFRLFAPSDGKGARGWCRRCGYFAWAEEGKAIDPEKAAAAEALRQQYMMQEAARLTAKIAELQQRAYWRGYHDAMREPHRALWRQAGIPDSMQDYWQLGFTPHYSDEIPSPALTIPYFAPSWSATNVQYRLTSPPQPNDKYRFSSGLRPGLWLTLPDEEPSGACLVMEGMKKAAVTFIELVAKAEHKITIVAFPSKTPTQEMMDALKECDPVYLALDPDAYHPPREGNGRSAVARISSKMNQERVRLVRLPEKADDLFNVYKFSPATFMRYVSQAVKVNC